MTSLKSMKSMALIAVAASASGALAGPGTKSAAPVSRRPAAPPVFTDGGPFTDNFDGYAAGSQLAPQNGWELWHTGGVNNATIEATHPASGPNCCRHVANTDVVQRFTIADGKWLFTVKTYVPSTAAPGVGGSVILLNQYQTPIDHWSMQIALNETGLAGSQTVPFMVESQWDGAVLPLVLDQWVEVKAEIDLDADVFNTWYNGQPLGVNLPWSNNGFGAGGITSIAALDLWSNNCPEIYFDDVSLTPIGACYPDCNGDGTLNLSDFGCYTTKFALGEAYADCNGDGVRNLADFGCFTTKFALGCP